MSEDLPDPTAAEPIVPPQAESSTPEFSAPLDGDPWDGPPMEETWGDAGSEGGEEGAAVEDFGLDDPFASGVPVPPVVEGGSSAHTADPILAQYRYLSSALLESHKSAGLRADGSARKIWKDKDAAQTFVGPTPKEQRDKASGKTAEPRDKKFGKKGKSGPWKGKGKKGAWKGKQKDEDPNKGLIDLLGRFRHELE